MPTTRALVLQNKERLAVQNVPVYPLASGEVRLETIVCGICGSDLRYYVGDNPWSQHTLGRQESVAWGRTILGHEVCARVTEVASGVTNLQIGDVVAVLPSLPCNECADCRSGNRNLCQKVSHLGHGGGWPDSYDREHFPGAMAASFVYFAASCFPVPLEKADVAEYALTDMVAVGVHAFKRAKTLRARPLGSGATGLVIGCGQVGLSIAQVARANSVVTIGVDKGSVPRQIADKVHIPCVESLDDKAAMGNFDAIWDTVCTEDTIKVALSRLNAGGVLVLLAPHESDFGIPPLSVGGERAVTTSCNFDPPEDFVQAIEMIATRTVDVHPYITRTVALADVPETFAELNRQRGNDFKVIVVPNRGKNL